MRERCCARQVVRLLYADSGAYKLVRTDKKKKNFVGFVAVEKGAPAGRGADVAVVWRGTITRDEWIQAGLALWCSETLQLSRQYAFGLNRLGDHAAWDKSACQWAFCDALCAIRAPRACTGLAQLRDCFMIGHGLKRQQGEIVSKLP